MDVEGIARPTGRRFSLNELAAAPIAEVFELLESRAEGLTTDEASARLRMHGPNLLPVLREPGASLRLARQMTHFFALMLWVAAILALAGGLPALAVAIVVVVIVNGVFSFVEEERANRATLALRALVPSNVVVIRDGQRSTLPVADLVPGDLVILREGDRISADARLIEGDGITVDESTLTGESVPVARDPVDDGTASMTQVFAGTYMASGFGRAVVYATGSTTRLGAIARVTSHVVRRPTPLRLDLDRAVRVIATLAVICGILFFGVSLLLGTPWRDGFVFAVGVIVALVPEGLLPTLSLSLAMSATRMARLGALVRHLEAVETLGATTVICSDKTGTMTTNQMTARQAWTTRRVIDATGSGWGSAGALLDGERPLSEDVADELAELLNAAALCGNARLDRKDGRWRCVGDPTEGALQVFARKGGIDREDAERSLPRVREYAFDSSRRRMTTVHRRTDGSLVAYTKGSPEAVLEVTEGIFDRGFSRPLAPEDPAAITAAIDRMTASGLRVLAFASRAVGDDQLHSVGSVERDLAFVGLVGLQDPVRPDVPAALASCHDAGIRVVMITGDHPLTARSVADAVGLSVQRVVTGDALPEDDTQLRGMLADPSVSVLARIGPEQKLRIARALQEGGAVVAMTGDGVNDAPALRQADIGIAMGASGTDVAREAADLVLLDDNFAHIVDAVREGRAAFDNIRKFLTYHLTDNVAELTPFALWALTAGRIPLMISVLQVLALDIGTDLLPALALGAERPEPGTMERPPRERSERLLSRHVLMRAFGFLGPVEATLSMAMLPIGAAIAFGWIWGTPLPAASADLAVLSAMVFASIVLMQMANAFECRSDPASLVSIGPTSNVLLVGAVLVEFLMLCLFLYLPRLSDVLGNGSLGPREWLPVVVTPFVFLLAEEGRKAWVRADPR
jgi:magnesium-transporting ATPase (P-type)